MHRNHTSKSNILPFKRRNRTGISAFAVLLVALPLAAFVAVFTFDGPPVSSAAVFSGQTLAADPFSTHFSRCGTGARYSCVVDGDTLWFKGEKVRVADINTPEISSPDCSFELKLGEQATERFIALLNQGAFDLVQVERDEDRYGRKLRVVTRGGRSLGEQLVTEGLAERWTGHRRNWCTGSR